MSVLFLLAVNITVMTDPPGAKLLRAGGVEMTCRTPCRFTVEKDSPSFDVMARLDGFRPAIHVINTDADRTYEFTLQATGEMGPDPCDPVAAAVEEQLRQAKLAMDTGRWREARALAQKVVAAARRAIHDGCMEGRWPGDEGTVVLEEARRCIDVAGCRLSRRCSR
jgi:hypothetical protein